MAGHGEVLPTATMLAELEALVLLESPSQDDAATERAARLVDDLLLAHLGSRGTWLASTPWPGSTT